MEPDNCTSLQCNSIGSAYCRECSHGRFMGSGVDSNGKEWRWSFNSRFGPLFLRKDGEPLKRQPWREDAPVWDAFDAWHRKAFPT